MRHTDTRMIVGTIHPHNHNDFLIPFFYGNVGSFWDILHNAYPHHNMDSFDSINKMLRENNVWITDIIRQCDRESAAVTDDKSLYNIVLNTEQIRNALQNSQIDTVYFTSRFGKNSAASLFTQAFGIDHKQSFDEAKSEFIVPESYFGRKIKCVVLYSPSNAANIGISRCLPYRSRHQHYQQFKAPVKQFKIDFYREKFQFLN